MKQSFSPPSILVIDDDYDIRAVLKMALEMEGYRVFSAASGEVAFEMLKARECIPNLIILDLMMPVITGWDFLNELKKTHDFTSIPVLVTSASENLSDIQSVQGVLPKPLCLTKMLDLITKHQNRNTA